MSKPIIIEETPLSMVEVGEKLEIIKKRDKEPGFRVVKTDEYINSFLSMKKKDGKEIIKKISDLKIPRLKDNHIYKIVDLMPHKPELVKLLFQGTPLTISEDSCKKIVKVVLEFRK